MSVLIKGMEMPKSCSKCGFFDMGGGDGYRCTLLRKSFEMWNKISVARDRSCPLIEVPTPHGRLGDLDELEKQFKRAIGTYLPKDPTRHMDIVNGSECRGWTQALMAVLEAKTVIATEE